jgi:lipoate-protein ligase B
LHLDDQSTFNIASNDAGSTVDVEQTRHLEVYDLGTIEYTKALELQRHYHKKVIEGSQGDLLLMCSHKPVYTCGTSTLPEHLYESPEELQARGAAVAHVERGGSVTYHGPEQAILYPIIDLHNHRTDVGWYMRSLEEVAIRTLSDYGITGLRISGKTGVWIDANSKIAFSGVRISRWCTLHGLSLNVRRCAEQFALINPCGLGSVTISSIEDLQGAAPSIQEVLERMIRHFSDVFGYS